MKDDEEANTFALLVLIPTEYIKNDIEKGIDLMDDKYLNKLSDKYKVSITIMHYRICYFFKYGI